MEISEFASNLREWPEENLWRAHTDYADDYEDDQWAAIEAELRTRGLLTGAQEPDEGQGASEPRIGSLMRAVAEDPELDDSDGRFKRGWRLSLLGLMVLSMPLVAHHSALPYAFLGPGALLLVLGKAERKSGIMRGNDGAVRILLTVIATLITACVALEALGLLPRWR